jgi:hypothetical protein
MSVHATLIVVPSCMPGAKGDSDEVHSSWNADYGFDRSFARRFRAEQLGLFGHQLEPSLSRVERRNSGHDYPAQAHEQPQAEKTSHSELQASATCQSDELQSKHDWLGQQHGKTREE